MDKENKKIRYIKLGTKAILSSLLFCFILLLNACTNDQSGPKDDTARITLTLDATQATRGLSTNENTVKDITVLVFNSAGEITGSTYQTFTGGPYTVNLIARTGTSTIYAIANTGSNSYFSGISNINDFKAKSASLTTAADLGNGGSVLMFGKKIGVDISSTTNISSGFALSRLCTKFIFNITPGSGITITGYQLCHVPMSSYITDEQSPSYNPGGAYNDFAAVTNLTSTSQVTDTYYTYENLAGTNSASTTEALRTSINACPNASYLLIYAKTSSWHSTYRIYLGGANSTDYTNYNIPRNYNYTCNINITGSGQSDARVTYASDIILPTGTYLYSDGTSGTSATAPSGKTTIGIVFSNRVSSEEASKGYHNYALALKDASSGIWSSSSADVGWLTNLGTWSAWYGDNQSGYVGTIDHNMGANSSNPAWYYAKNYNNTVPCNFPCSGWYLPSVGQWWDVFTGLGKVNLNTQQGSSSGGQMNISASTALSNINSLIPAAVGTKIPSGTYYWSASEYSPAYMALLVQFSSNGVMIYYYNKSDTYYTVMIRAVVAF